MAGSHFEPFGESIAQHREDSSSMKDSDGSPALRYAGMGVFWALVLTIVAARTIFFDPGFAGALTKVTSFIASLAAVLS